MTCVVDILVPLRESTIPAGDFNVCIKNGKSFLAILRKDNLVSILKANLLVAFDFVRFFLRV